jgi:uncharacterized protein YnzC (UPF0291/DUF896 family)
MNSLLDNQSFIEITEQGEIRVHINSIAKAKLAIKELKLRKKEYSITKREISNQQQPIRATYTDQVRRQGSKVHGKGFNNKGEPGAQQAHLREDITGEPELLQEITTQRSLMIAVSTGGPRIQEKNQEYQERRSRIRTYIFKQNMDDPNPYPDLWAWYGKWRREMRR